MDLNSIYGWCIFAGFLPFLTVALILGHYYVFRVRYLRVRPSNKKRGRFSPSTGGLSIAFQNLSLFYRPRLVYAFEAQKRQTEDVDEDDDGEPDTPEKHLQRQLRRIRNGEPVERLVLRL